MKKIFLYTFMATIICVSCDKEEVKTINILPSSDGYIVNSAVAQVSDYHNGSQGKELRIGWNNMGQAMRAFVGFDITPILPGEDEKLTINNAVLKVFEANTNLHPFDGDNGNRTVEVSLLEYGTLDKSDFDMQTIAACGTIATWGYSVLEQHHLDVKEILNEYYQSDPMNIDQVQFRLQFTNDHNIEDPDNSELDGSMWSIFSSEDNSDFVPVLEIEYKIEDE